jgi:hypothetical protein
MISTQKKARPDCKDILKKKDLWYLNIDCIMSITKDDVISTTSMEESFHKYFIQKKMFKNLNLA